MHGKKNNNRNNINSSDWPMYLYNAARRSRADGEMPWRGQAETRGPPGRLWLIVRNKLPPSLVQLKFNASKQQPPLRYLCFKDFLTFHFSVISTSHSYANARSEPCGVPHARSISLVAGPGPAVAPAWPPVCVRAPRHTQVAPALGENWGEKHETSAGNFQNVFQKHFNRTKNTKSLENV